MKSKYAYYVVFYYSKNSAHTMSGYGSCTLYKHKKLDTEKEVQDLVRLLINQYGYATVIIQNFILLNKRGKK